MELHQLKYFLAIVDSGTISRAAVRCGIAQPSLSQQLKKLERTLGIELFQREGRGVVLTDAGRALLPRARKILAEVQDAEANLKRDVESGHGRLAIGAIPTIAPYVLPDAINAVLRRRPECEITVREDLTEHLIDSLLDNQLDCALIASPIEHNLIEIDSIGIEDLLAVVPADWSVPEDGRVSLSDLRDQPTISLHEMHCLGQQVELFCKVRRLRTQMVCQTTQLSTILEFVGLGMGISLVPEMTAAADRSNKRRYLRIRSNKPTRMLCIAWRKGRARAQAAEAFVAAIRGFHRAGRYRRDG